MRLSKSRICLHKNIACALLHPSAWAGVAGVLSSTGAELDKPYSIFCFVGSAFCSVMAICIRTPPEIARQEEKQS